MDGFPPRVRYELEGWSLWWADLERAPGGEAALDAIWSPRCAAVRERFRGGPVAEHPAARRVRRLFREAGCDPTRYRPSSEALIRRVLRDGELPRIEPLVDLNNLLSMELVLPCCVVDAASVRPPFVLRRGEHGERMASLRGPFDLGGKPVLEDADGPFGTPITDSERVRITRATARAWLVVYRPRGLDADPGETLRALLAAAPVAELLATT